MRSLITLTYFTFKLGNKWPINYHSIHFSLRTVSSVSSAPSLLLGFCFIMVTIGRSRSANQRPSCSRLRPIGAGYASPPHKERKPDGSLKGVGGFLTPPPPLPPNPCSWRFQRWSFVLWRHKLTRDSKVLGEGERERLGWGWGGEEEWRSEPMFSVHN